MSNRRGLPSTYSMVTWVLPSGRRYGHGAVLAYHAQPLGEPVRQRDRQRHELRRLVAGEPEHQALIARALLGDLVVRALDTRLVGGVDPLRDVR